MKAAIGELERRVPKREDRRRRILLRRRHGVDICWLRERLRLAAAAPFYGPLPDNADFAGSPNAAVLGIYAEEDDRVNASRDAAKPQRSRRPASLMRL